VCPPRVFLFGQTPLIVVTIGLAGAVGQGDGDDAVLFVALVAGDGCVYAASRSNERDARRAVASESQPWWDGSVIAGNADGVRGGG
jgi:hypothetical protein